MPLFNRPDGDLVKNESNVRRMIPYLMHGRNESAIYHDELYDLTRTKPWLAAYNRSHAQPATLFHLLLWVLGQTMHKRPGLNRFVSGHRIYQRRGVQLSFAVKKKLSETDPLTTIKLPFAEGETFGASVAKIVAAIDDGRSDRVTTVDKELRLLLALPGPLVRFVMAMLRGLDRVNLMPKGMIDTDPMYATAFVANLGSIGLDQTYHHLYEYGTISLFGAMGTPKKTIVVGPDGQPAVTDAVNVRWTFDERINDGFYCATAIRVVKRMFEDPEKYIGAATADATRVAEPEAPRIAIVK